MPSDMTEPFTGWPTHTYSWLGELEENNEKPWFEANRGPFNEMKSASESFVAELATTLKLSGTPKVWRIYRDQRFSKGEPYKTEHDMGVLDDDGVLHGLRIEPDGVVVAFGVGGIGGFAKEPLAKFRKAIMEPKQAAALAGHLDELRGLGFELGEPELKRPSKDLPDGHPHPELSRHKSLFLTKTYAGQPKWLFKQGALDRIAADLTLAAPLRTWLVKALA